MNLKQHIIETPSHASDLAAIQNHSETSLRMISNKTMMLYLKATGLYLYIHQVADGVHDVEGVDHAAKETCLMIKNSLLDGSADGGDFNFMEGTAKGDGVIADTEALKITMPTKSDNLDGLLTVCKEHCNNITYPFADTTQEELDAVKAEIALYAPTLPNAIGHPHIDSTIGYTVTTSNKPVQVAAILTAPAPVDMTIEVFFHTDYSDTQVFDTVGLKVGFIRIKQGETNGSINISKSLSRKIQASAVSDVVCDYNLIIKG